MNDILVTESQVANRTYHRQDITGQRFGRLVALRPVGRKTHTGKDTIWLFKCDCGNETTGTPMAVKKPDHDPQGKKSCGCLKVEVQRERHLRHGHTSADWKSRTYEAWLHAKCMTTNPKSGGWSSIGARGIRMCKPWFDDFENFLRDMGEAPEGYSLSRLHMDRDYMPENCEWTTIRMLRSRASRSKHTRDFRSERGQTEPPPVRRRVR